MESSHKYRGKLTIYLGYSPGVGKTYEMLSNAINLYKEGVDIKIGYIEPHINNEKTSIIQGIAYFALSSKLSNL